MTHRKTDTRKSQEITRFLDNLQDTQDTPQENIIDKWERMQIRRACSTGYSLFNGGLLLFALVILLFLLMKGVS